MIFTKFRLQTNNSLYYLTFLNITKKRMRKQTLSSPAAGLNGKISNLKKDTQPNLHKKK